MGARLCIGAIYQNEAPYLREWVEFHRLVGVERFFLYDHESTDNHRQVLAPYVEDGTVLIHDWPVQPGQKEAYNHCIAEHQHDSRWIAFIDVDEFLFSPRGEPVPDVLRDYDAFSGVGVPWAIFGTSGHTTRPPGLVIENYTSRVTRPRKSRHFKSIVDPTHAARALGPHAFAYKDDFYDPVPRFAMFDRLRINHYWTKSEEELRQKFERVRADTGDAYAASVERALTLTSSDRSVFDNAIFRYLPAVGEALAAREPELSS